MKRVIVVSLEMLGFLLIGMYVSYFFEGRSELHHLWMFGLMLLISARVVKSETE